MEYCIIKVRRIPVCFYPVELSRAGSGRDFSIISAHWQEFNHLLRVNKICLGAGWAKYGITMNTGDKTLYQCAFPSRSPIEPFEYSAIPAGDYVKIDHRGSMGRISETIDEIYRKLIPNAGIETDLGRSLVHFERYDSRFHWNRRDSLVELYVPVLN